MAEADLERREIKPSIKWADLPVVAPDGDTLIHHNIVGFNSRDSRARPFNLLRTRFAKQISNQGLRLIGITSATPSAGKSFLSLNLAASLARVSETPVFLVDLDLRRGSVAEELGVEVETGVSDFLEGKVDSLGKVGWRIDDTKLAIFPTNPVTTNSAELVAGERFDEMMDQLRHRSSDAIILFDMPPAFASDDAMLSLQGMDGYVLIVDSGVTSRRQVRDTMVMLEPTPCVGTILNRYRGGISDSYGYGYGYSAYSRYYSD